jgi:hypothetical protein
LAVARQVGWRRVRFGWPARSHEMEISIAPEMDYFSERIPSPLFLFQEFLFSSVVHPQT